MRGFDALPWIFCTDVRRQNILTLSSKIVLDSDFSDTAYNSAYVSDVQSLVAKVLCNNFSAKIFCYKIEMFGEIWNKNYTKKAF